MHRQIGGEAGRVRTPACVRGDVHVCVSCAGVGERARMDIGGREREGWSEQTGVPSIPERRPIDQDH